MGLISVPLNQKVCDRIATMSNVKVENLKQALSALGYGPDVMDSLSKKAGRITFTVTIHASYFVPAVFNFSALTKRPRVGRDITLPSILGAFDTPETTKDAIIKIEAFLTKVINVPKKNLRRYKIKI